MADVLTATDNNENSNKVSFVFSISREMTCAKYSMCQRLFTLIYCKLEATLPQHYTVFVIAGPWVSQLSEMSQPYSAQGTP